MYRIGRDVDGGEADLPSLAKRENAAMCTSASQYLPAGPTEAFGW